MLNRLSLEQGKIYLVQKFLYCWTCRQGEEIQLVEPNREPFGHNYALISRILESLRAYINKTKFLLLMYRGAFNPDRLCDEKF